MSKFYVLSLAAFLMIAGCGKKEEPVPTPSPSTETVQAAKIDSTHPTAAPGKPAPITGMAALGQKLFYSTTYGKIKDACASCHTDGMPTTSDNRIRSGHTVVGVMSRPSTWNGQFKGDARGKNGYGATLCAVMYLHKGDDIATAMPKADVDALNAYFDAIKGNAGAMTNALKIQWVIKPALHEDDKIDEKTANAAAKTIMMLPADPAAGKDTYDRTCAYCHSMTEKKVGLPLNKGMESPQLGARAVRCGSGAMPFYGKDILTDQQIADVVAYIQQQLGR